jgi:hypothetical protein
LVGAERVAGEADGCDAGGEAAWVVGLVADPDDGADAAKAGDDLVADVEGFDALFAGGGEDVRAFEVADGLSGEGVGAIKVLGELGGGGFGAGDGERGGDAARCERDQAGRADG